jgi:hypothetical protein
MLMMTLYEKKFNDHGVSEAIGFMLIFTIVIAGIGLVTLYGYPLLLQQQVGADEKIMEKNMIVLQNDIKSLAYKTVPFKETSLKIGGGSLTVHNASDSPSSLIIYTDIAYPLATNPLVNNFKPGELRFESVSAQTDISLQNGAVVLRPRTSQGSIKGSAMLSEPRWFYDDTTQTMVINLINITRTNLISKQGIGTVQMKLGETNYTYKQIAAGDTVKVVYTPDPANDYSVAWDSYFKKIPVISTVGTPGLGTPITYTLPPIKTLVIKKFDIQIVNI